MILQWVSDVCDGLQSFFTGMRQTGLFLVENLRDEGGATAMTRQYPEQPAEVVGDRQRGHLHNQADICIVCHACDKACPVDCFKMDGERDANNKLRASRFDIDLSKCIYCGLCVRACPTDSLTMTADFQMDPRIAGQRYLFRRNSSQLDVRLEGAEVERLQRLSLLPREQLSTDDREWLDARIDVRGQHLIGMYGVGYFTAEEKAQADAEREAKKKAKDAAVAAAKAKAAAEAKASPAAVLAGTPHTAGAQVAGQSSGQSSGQPSPQPSAPPGAGGSTS